MSERFVAADIAIIGGGLAGMSLLAHLGAAGWAGRVAVIDNGAHDFEARAWAWWSRGELLLDSAATAHYNVARCASDTWVKTSSLEPYAYRTITGAMLAQTVQALVSNRVRVTRVDGSAVALSRDEDEMLCTVRSGHGLVEVRAGRVYDSVGVSGEGWSRSPVPRLDFVGWKVHSDVEVFSPGVMTLMDFRTDQSQGLAFMYVLPGSGHDALIDHTVYVTDSAAPQINHERHVREYLLAVFGARHVTLVQVEQGPIPLDVSGSAAREATLIGAAAGAVKLSTGYAFSRIQRHCGAIADAVVAGKPDPPLATSGRLARVLDRVLLGVIRAESQAGQTMFEALVRRLDWKLLFAFLDEDASIRDHLRVCVRVPPRAFIRAALKRSRRRSTPREMACKHTALTPAREHDMGDTES